MSTDPARYELGLDDSIAFMRRLKDAGMSNEEVVKHGYTYALELSAMWKGEPVGTLLQMERASVKLELATLELGIHTKNEETHGGIIRIDSKTWQKMFADTLTIDATDTQGVLRDKGVFTEVRKLLLLPETYIVHNIFYEWLPSWWNIVVEGPDLPLAVEGLNLPYLTPLYQRNEDGSNSLVRIDS